MINYNNLPANWCVIHDFSHNKYQECVVYLNEYLKLYSHKYSRYSRDWEVTNACLYTYSDGDTFHSSDTLYEGYMVFTIDEFLYYLNYNNTKQITYEYYY